MKLLAVILAVFTRLWDWFMSPKRQKRRSDREVDKAIANHDEKKVNEILDRSL